ncbi:MAG: transporter substrate-binding domain-containing protein [SAR324 cluster bacterium]|nr:transporter substrate-binding domain-containing protein [SAR324 cluster bacterium]
MKIAISIIFCIFLLSHNSLAQTSPSSQTIRITTGEWPPYHSQEREQHNIGNQIVTKAFALVGIEVKYGFFGWKRAYDQAKSGRWDGSSAWRYIQERENDFYYSDSIYEGNMVFFHLKNFPFDWESVSDLKRIRIGATRPYSYGEAFDAAAKARQIKVQWTNSDKLNFKKLLKGKIQLFPNQKNVGYYQLKQLFIPKVVQQITHHPRAITKYPLYLILSKKNPDNQYLIELFNRGLRQLQATREIEELYKDLRENQQKEN